MYDRKLVAKCGLYCGVCGVYFAHRDNNQKFKERLTAVYGCSIEDLACEGCGSDVRAAFCMDCHFRACNEERGYEGCFQCDDFPCKLFDDFPIPVGKKVIMRAVPHWREVGTEQYVKDEESRYHCPHCGYFLFRGAKRCRQCKEPVDLD